jgi:DNA repair exonuclease SbcCD nuclease subunit
MLQDQTTMNSRPQVTIVHSSDLHLGVDDSFSNADSLAVLPKVLGTAAEVQADVVVLAGDTFDNHRQPLELLERAAEMLRD